MNIKKSVGFLSLLLIKCTVPMGLDRAPWRRAQVQALTTKISEQHQALSNLHFKPCCKDWSIEAKQYDIEILRREIAWLEGELRKAEETANNCTTSAAAAAASDSKDSYQWATKEDYPGIDW